MRAKNPAMLCYRYIADPVIIALSGFTFKEAAVPAKHMNLSRVSDAQATWKAFKKSCFSPERRFFDLGYKFSRYVNRFSELRKNFSGFDVPRRKFRHIGYIFPGSFSPGKKNRFSGEKVLFLVLCGRAFLYPCGKICFSDPKPKYCIHWNNHGCKLSSGAASAGWSPPA